LKWNSKLPPRRQVPPPPPNYLKRKAEDVTLVGAGREFLSAQQGNHSVV